MTFGMEFLQQQNSDNNKRIELNQKAAQLAEHAQAIAGHVELMEWVVLGPPGRVKPVRIADEGTGTEDLPEFIYLSVRLSIGTIELGAETEGENADEATHYVDLRTLGDNPTELLFGVRDAETPEGRYIKHNEVFHRSFAGEDRKVGLSFGSEGYIWTSDEMALDDKEAAIKAAEQGLSHQVEVLNFIFERLGDPQLNPQYAQALAHYTQQG